MEVKREKDYKVVGIETEGDEVNRWGGNCVVLKCEPVQKERKMFDKEKLAEALWAAHVEWKKGENKSFNPCFRNISPRGMGCT